MALTSEQKEFFEANGYLRYEKVLTDQELELLRNRIEAIIAGKLTHVPDRFIQLEADFKDEGIGDTPRLDAVRKVTHLTYFDDMFEETCRKPEIVDVIEDLIGPNLKLYTDQLMMKPRFNGTVTGWHQDSVAWP
ncbi:MAG: phytanoyl-CoA dioxygenase family protein, partial [Planctomycetota bacterium]|nr:phytanoyl-CoA dioxygenase family protein [Planctomycetota bacterium]